MGLNKIRLGDYIIRSTQNNRDLKYGVELISGVTSQGVFAIPKGDPIDVNLKPYKIVNNGAFVYNPTRLDLGSIAYRTDGLCIVSHLYMVFYLTEEGKRIIDPTWLYIYFRRNEFLREVTFRNFGSQRPEFNFEDMSDIIIPLPDLPTQQKYVDIYNAMVANQQAYERGLEDLKLTCDGYIEELRRKMPCEKIGKYIIERNIKNEVGLNVDSVRGISTGKELIDTKANMDGVPLGNYKIVKPNEIAFISDTSRRGDKISLAINSSPKTYLVSSISTVFETNKNGNVKKCAVGKYPKSEKHGNTAQFSEVERSGTQKNCGGIGSGCRLRLRPLPVPRRRQPQRVARIDPNAVVVDKNIAENDRFDLFSR